MTCFTGATLINYVPQLFFSGRYLLIAIFIKILKNIFFEGITTTNRKHYQCLHVITILLIEMSEHKAIFVLAGNIYVRAVHFKDNHTREDIHH